MSPARSYRTNRHLDVEHALQRCGQRYPLKRPIADLSQTASLTLGLKKHKNVALAHRALQNTRYLVSWQAPAFHRKLYARNKRSRRVRHALIPSTAKSNRPHNRATSRKTTRHTCTSSRLCFFDPRERSRDHVKEVTYSTQPTIGSVTSQAQSSRLCLIWPNLFQHNSPAAPVNERTSSQGARSRG